MLELTEELAERSFANSEPCRRRQRQRHRVRRGAREGRDPNAVLQHIACETSHQLSFVEVPIRLLGAREGICTERSDCPVATTIGARARTKRRLKAASRKIRGNEETPIMAVATEVNGCSDPERDPVGTEMGNRVLLCTAGARKISRSRVPIRQLDLGAPDRITSAAARTTLSMAVGRESA